MAYCSSVAQHTGLHRDHVEVFRRRVVWLLVEKELLAEDFAIRLLGWKHSGFSVDNSVRILDREAVSGFVGGV